MREEIQTIVDRQLGLLAGLVYLRPTEEEQEEVYQYIGEKAPEIFGEFREAPFLERLDKLLRIANDIDREKEKEEEDHLDDLITSLF